MEKGTPAVLVEMRERGQQSVFFALNSKYGHTFLICTLPTEAAGLIGTDFLENLRELLDFDCCKMVLLRHKHVPQVYSVLIIPQCALTVFSTGRDGCNPRLRKRDARCMDEQIPARPSPEIRRRENISWLLRTTDSVTIAPTWR